MEGWFRLRFRLNNTFLNFLMGISSNRFAASDVYIDGQQVASFGNTGLDGNAYQEYQGSLYPTGNLNLEVNVDHVLALHLVDYRSPLNSFHLKTQENADPGGYYNLIAFAGPNANSKFIFFIKDFEVYFGIWSSVCGVLSILFWLLYFQNRNEKNLIAIAWSTTLLSVSIFFVKMDSLAGISHIAHIINIYLSTFLLNIAFTVILYTLARIFKRKISIALLLYLVFTCFSSSSF